MMLGTGCKLFLLPAVVEDTMKKQGLTDLSVNTLSAMAENGRLPKLSAVLKAFQTIMSAHRGEVTCSVTTAKPLDAKSMDELKAALSGFLTKGQTLHLDVQVCLSMHNYLLIVHTHKPIKTAGLLCSNRIL